MWPGRARGVGEGGSRPRALPPRESKHAYMALLHIAGCRTYPVHAGHSLEARALRTFAACRKNIDEGHLRRSSVCCSKTNTNIL